MDIYDKQKRSEIMSKVRSKNTTPERLVRKILHQMGYRFRLYRSDLPGKPDIVLSKHRKIVLVNGCFWHGHRGCSRARLPNTNVEFWRDKIRRNVERDQENMASLISQGWNVLVVWECETKDVNLLRLKLKEFMES